MRTCSKCKLTKDLSCFSKDKHNVSGYCCVCKECRKETQSFKKEYYQEYRQKNSLNNILYQKEYRSKNKQILREKFLQNFTEEKRKKKNLYSKLYYQNNKERVDLKRKQYLDKNKEKIELYQKNYRLIHRKRLSVLHNAYIKSRKASDVLFKLRRDISDLITKSFTDKGYSKKSKTYTLLGCDFETFKAHIESMFKEGMTWENKGKYGWHIDHIFPNSLCKTEEELIKNQHYKNLQPLWAQENLKKSNKVEKDL